jgi:hypothetical protein
VRSISKKEISRARLCEHFLKRKFGTKMGAGVTLVPPSFANSISGCCWKAIRITEEVSSPHTRWALCSKKRPIFVWFFLLSLTSFCVFFPAWLRQCQVMSAQRRNPSSRNSRDFSRRDAQRYSSPETGVALGAVLQRLVWT